MNQQDQTSAGREIERKFLLAELPEGVDAFPRHKVRQGYLVIAESGAEVRVRAVGDQFFMTAKSEPGEARAEVEVPISASLFNRLWPLTRGKRVRKVRYEMVHEGRIIEVDVYQKKLKGLITAEVEFPDEDSAGEFHGPDWLSWEVTGDDRFSNQHLACHGISKKALAESAAH